ncbi:putative CTD small phosphatase-like protein 2 [Quillaja saponaria]|uniref:CTD small phosphatase-like protein 2 n=1 Tax=Quillaja saponaria TaxID=32244 RepID=A0AAD7KZ47_QUISA|nr:putative CTD small phosphatase-like protein 2 [Quillaja saponaria]
MSSMSKALSESPEESSWTMYLEDFSFNNNTEHNCSISSSSSLVSDAASLAAKNIDNRDPVVDLCVDHKSFTKKRLSFQKRKTKSYTKEAALVDDALEDTASSPVNSPKKGNGSGQTNDQRNEFGFDGRDDGDRTELKKRGLCLVPLSMIVNYLG